MVSSHLCQPGHAYWPSFAFKDPHRENNCSHRSNTHKCCSAHARRLGNVGKYGAEITYQHESSIDYDEVSKLLHKVDWPPRRQSKLQKAVENSFFLATLRAQHDSEDQELIGFARIDGAFNAQIWDVIIDPAFQERGLGRKLVEEIVKHLIDLDIKNITTFAERSGTRFYEKLGFQTDPDGVRGMFWRQMQ